MIFDIIFATPPPIYPSAHEIQVVQPHYSAQDLGPPIAIEEKQNSSINFTKSQKHLIEQLQFNLETLNEENLNNPSMSVKLKKIEYKFGQIDSVSIDIKTAFVKSTLELNSQEIKTKLNLLSESGFSFKIKGELQSRDLELNIEPVFGFKKSLNWFEDHSKTEPEGKKVSLQQAMRFAVLRRLTLNSAYLNSLRINQENEIDDSPENIQSLTRSLNSLATSQFAKKTIFSLEEDLENLSAKLDFPVPGILSDELELKIKTNLPEVLVDGEDLQDKMKSTLSLRYRIAIDDATKLEIESSYNLQETTHKTLIRFTLINLPGF